MLSSWLWLFFPDLLHGLGLADRCQGQEHDILDALVGLRDRAKSRLWRPIADSSSLRKRRVSVPDGTAQCVVFAKEEADALAGKRVFEFSMSRPKGVSVDTIV